jgi:hypothetical protein
MHFEKTNLSHIEIIWGWLAETYVQEFWDNRPGHKDDILNFMKGRKNLEHKIIGIDQGNQTLATILRLQVIIPEVIKVIEGKL